MNVYFSASLSRYRKLLPLTSDIAQMIEKMGHTVTSRHVISTHTTDGNWEKKYNPRGLYEREMRRLANSDVLITEATTPSYGGGFLIQSAIAMGKPILTLHYGDDIEKAPLMLRGHPNLNLKVYTENNIKGVLKSFFNSVESKVVKPLKDFDQSEADLTRPVLKS